MLQYQKHLLQRAEPMTDSAFENLQKQIQHGCRLPTCSPDNFKQQFHQWIVDNPLNKLQGLELFQQDICVGTTHFIDAVLMKHGSDKVQILEHDYGYYKKLNPQRQWAVPGSLMANQVLLMALPFPGYGDIHPQMTDILDECQEKNIAVYIDGCWMSSARDIAFDFRHPAIVAAAFSLSKGLGMGWNRIGVRYSRPGSSPDSIAVINRAGMINTVDIQIGSLYMHEFPPEYLWQKYASTYDQLCRSLLLRPTKCIHMARKFDTGEPVGTAVALRIIQDNYVGME
jgi:hypothetical protein